MNNLFAALACLLLSVPVFASDPVARINGDDISRADVDAFVAFRPTWRPRLPETSGCR